MTPEIQLLAQSDYYSEATAAIIREHNNNLIRCKAEYDGQKRRIDRVRALFAAGDFNSINVEEFANLPDQKAEKLKFVLGVLKSNTDAHAAWLEHGKPELDEQHRELKAAVQKTHDDLSNQLRESGFAENRISGAVHANKVYNAVKNEKNAVSSLLNRNGRDDSGRRVGSSEFKHALLRLTPNAWVGF